MQHIRIGPPIFGRKASHAIDIIKRAKTEPTIEAIIKHIQKPTVPRKWPINGNQYKRE